MDDQITYALQRNTFIALDDFSKSIHSDHYSSQSNVYRMKQRPRHSKDFCRSQLKESSQKRNHSRLANNQLNSRLRSRNNGIKYNKSMDRSKKKETVASMYTSCQQWTKHPTSGHAKPLKPQRSIQLESQQMLQLVIQKQKIIKDLDKRIEAKMSQWLLFEAEVNRKMASYTSQLTHVTEELKTEKQELNAIRHRIADSQEQFNTRSNELSKRKQQVEELCRYVEQTTRDQDFLKCQLEAEKSACRAKVAQYESMKKQLQTRDKEVVEAEANIRTYEQEILESMAQLQKRQRQISQKNAELQLDIDKHQTKELQLEQRERVISMYVNQLDSCINNLTNERSSLLNINSNLERRCNQLETLQLKLFRKINDSSTNQLDRYLTDSTNIAIRTPIRRSKQNISAFTERKISQKKEQRQVTIQERSSDLLEESPQRYDFANLC